MLSKINLLHLAAILLLITGCRVNERNTTDKLAFMDKDELTGKTDTATFGGGCFWCGEAIFSRLDGVEKVISGYSGGHIKNPTYEMVSEENTGHAEVFQVQYDAQKISYDDLLQVFWQTHDPTTLNRQGNDVGPQYRSIIFYHNKAQKQKAEYYKAALEKSKVYPNPIVTSIEPFETFYPAEDYHQNYYKRNPNQPYCRFVIQPKLKKFEEVFKHRLKKE